MFILIDQAYGHRLTPVKGLLKNWEKVQNIPGMEGLKEHSGLEERESKALTHQALSAYASGKKYSKPKQVFYASDIMSSKVFSVLENEKVETVVESFIQKRYRHIPIVNSENTVVGLVSDRDIHNWNKKNWTESIEEREQRLKEPETVSIFKKEVVCASSNTPIRMMAHVMLEKRMGCMPVVTDDAKIEGIVTRSDILRAIVNFAPLEIWL
jgi:CBS domain-containing protein